MIKFSYTGNDVRILDINEETFTDELKPAIYQVCHNQFIGFYLEKIKDQFEINEEKIFGRTLEMFEKIDKTYTDRFTSTGILLTGTKGSGKTLLAEYTCNKMLEKNIPVVIVNESFQGTEFAKFMSDIGNCVVFIDEFAKVYSKSGDDVDSGNDPQSSLLTILNGVYSSKRLVILTENDSDDINEFMIGRTGRIYYHWKFNRLDSTTIKEYCDYHEIEESVTAEILDVSHRCRDFTFDILKAILEEFKRFGGGIDTLIKDLNIELLESAELTNIKVVKVINSSTNEEIPFDNNAQFRKINLSYFGSSTYFELGVDKQLEKSYNSIASVSNSDYDFETAYPGVRDIVYQSETSIIFELQRQNIVIITELVEDTKIDPKAY